MPRAQGGAVFLRKSLLILHFAAATLRAGIHPRRRASEYSARLINTGLHYWKPALIKLTLSDSYRNIGFFVIAFPYYADPRLRRIIARIQKFYRTIRPLAIADLFPAFFIIPINHVTAIAVVIIPHL